MAASNFNLDLVSFAYLDMDLFRSKSIHTFRLSQEEDLELLMFWVSVDEMSNALVNLVILSGDVFVKDFTFLFNMFVDFFLFVCNYFLIILIKFKRFRIQLLLCGPVDFFTIYPSFISKFILMRK